MHTAHYTLWTAIGPLGVISHSQPRWDDGLSLDTSDAGAELTITEQFVGHARFHIRFQCSSDEVI